MCVWYFCYKNHTKQLWMKGFYLLGFSCLIIDSMYLYLIVHTVLWKCIHHTIIDRVPLDMKYISKIISNTMLIWVIFRFIWKYRLEWKNYLHVFLQLLRKRNTLIWWQVRDLIFAKPFHNQQNVSNIERHKNINHYEKFTFTYRASTKIFNTK